MIYWDSIKHRVYLEYHTPIEFLHCDGGLFLVCLETDNLFYYNTQSHFLIQGDLHNKYGFTYPKIISLWEILGYPDFPPTTLLRV